MTDSPFKATVSADLFARASLAQSNAPTRPYLCGVHIEPVKAGEPGAYLVATDGHKMLVFYDPSASVEGSAIVALPKDLLKRCKDGETLEVSDTGASVGGLQAGSVLIDETFPNWRHAFPSHLPSDANCYGVFDQVVLAPLAKALSIGKMQALALAGIDAESPHIVRGTHPDGFGIVLGVREGSRPAPGLPGWFE